MIEEKLVCLEMDDASGRDKRNGRRTRLEDWIYYRDFLKSIGAFVTIAIEPQKASEDVMKFLASNPEQFFPSVHGTVKYGHYGGYKTEEQVKEMWEWTVKEIQKFGFDIGMDGNGLLIPPMHMISDTAIGVLNQYGVKVIGSGVNNFPLGSKDVRNSKGEQVYILERNVEAYTPYKGITFYKRFRPWIMSADMQTKQQVIESIEKIKGTSKRAQLIDGSYETYLELCMKDFREKCYGNDCTFYAHEINLSGGRPFMHVLEKIVNEGILANVRFTNPVEFTMHYSKSLTKP